MLTKIGIVYATVSGMVRRWIIPDDDADLGTKHHVAAGEAMLIVDKASIKSRADIDAAVAAVIGKPVPSPRCAVIKKGKVVDVIMADPALDNVPGATLVLSEEAGLNQAFDVVTGTFTDPVVVVE